MHLLTKGGHGFGIQPYSILKTSLHNHQLSWNCAGKLYEKSSGSQSSRMSILLRLLIINSQHTRLARTVCLLNSRSKGNKVMCELLGFAYKLP